ncbi:MAG: hypothetical protein Q8M94_09560, partial [Ignavibacteria bacterium]|nr:hypothetical protein [Ignavibacteria bacterium]
MFLIVSGIVNVFANKRNADGKLPNNTIYRRLRTAFMLMFIGYFLFFPADKIFHLAFIDAAVWKPFLQVNILQLIGVSLLLLILTFVFTRSDKSLGITAFSIAILITVVNPSMNMVNWFNYLPEVFASYLSMEHSTSFTIFPFTGFMFYGVAFGTILKKVEPVRRIDFLKKWGLIIGVVFLLVGIPLNIYINTFHLHFVDALKANSGMMLIRIGCVFVSISAISYLYSATSGLKSYYSIFGKRALLIYIAHLIFLYGLPWFGSIGQAYHQKLPLYLTVQLAILVQLLSLVAAYYYEKSLKTFPTAKMFYRY